jgi:hypothetical protein
MGPLTSTCSHIIGPMVETRCFPSYGSTDINLYSPPPRRFAGAAPHRRRERALLVRYSSTLLLLAAHARHRTVGDTVTGEWSAFFKHTQTLGSTNRCYAFNSIHTVVLTHSTPHLAREDASAGGQHCGAAQCLRGEDAERVGSKRRRRRRRSVAVQVAFESKF